MACAEPSRVVADVVEQVEAAVSYRHAAELLGVSLRRVQQLVRETRLEVVGIGHRKRITRHSVETYVRKSETSGKFGKKAKSSGLNSSGFTPHTETRKPMLQQSQPQQIKPALLTLDRSANELGVSSYLVRRMIRDGLIKTIAVGSRVRIPRGEIARLAGERSN